MGASFHGDTSHKVDAVTLGDRQVLIGSENKRTLALFLSRDCENNNLWKSLVGNTVEAMGNEMKKVSDGAQPKRVSKLLSYVWKVMMKHQLNHVANQAMEAVAAALLPPKNIYEGEGEEEEEEDEEDEDGDEVEVEAEEREKQKGKKEREESNGKILPSTSFSLSDNPSWLSIWCSKEYSSFLTALGSNDEKPLSTQVKVHPLPLSLGVIPSSGDDGEINENEEARKEREENEREEENKREKKKYPFRSQKKKRRWFSCISKPVPLPTCKSDAAPLPKQLLYTYTSCGGQESRCGDSERSEVGETASDRESERLKRKMKRKEMRAQTREKIESAFPHLARFVASSSLLLSSQGDRFVMSQVTLREKRKSNKERKKEVKKEREMRARNGSIKSEAKSEVERERESESERENDKTLLICKNGPVFIAAVVPIGCCRPQVHQILKHNLHSLQQYILFTAQHAVQLNGIPQNA